MGVEAVPDGLVDAWRLWRHCLCRFGWYPLFVAPLVTCACILDVFSSTGCDFIRMDIGFEPINDEWQKSQASLGLFSFDSQEIDKNKWKRSFNNGCQLYSDDFESEFLGSDQSWQIARILADISGISSAIACATVWLLTITPLPASFFWPGVLLPAVVLAMVTGAAKFIFFDAMICSEDLWYMDESSPPVPPQSCELGESAIFGIASTVAYFLCTILICFKSPRKRKLDENFGKIYEETSDSKSSKNTQNSPGGTDIECRDIEMGDTKAPMLQRKASLSDSGNTIKANNAHQTPEVVTGHHVRTTSDVTWEGHGNLGVLSPVFSQQPQTQPQKAKPQHHQSDDDSQSAQSIVMVINDTHSRSYSEGSSGASGKFHSLPAASTTSSSRLPPRHNGGKAHRREKSTSSDPDDSLPSKVSKLSYADTHCLSETDQQSAESSQKDTPLVVAIPNRKSSPNTKSAVANRLRFSSPKKREDRNDTTQGDTSAVQKREKFEYLPPLEEGTPQKNTNEDHGDLINKFLQDLELSFVDEQKNGYDTL